MSVDDRWANLSWRERVSYIRSNPGEFDYEFRALSDLVGCVRGHYFSGDPANLSRYFRRGCEAGVDRTTE